jgi:hypothetical protein
MSGRPIGERAMTNAERQARHRAKIRERYAEYIRSIFGDVPDGLTLIDAQEQTEWERRCQNLPLAEDVIDA